MGDTGFESSRLSKQKTQGTPGSDVKSDAIAPEIIADLLFRRLAAAWPRLPESDRLELVEAAERAVRFAESLPEGLDGADCPASGVTTAAIRRRMADWLFG